jgi:HlyD family secretion protein
MKTQTSSLSGPGNDPSTASNPAPAAPGAQLHPPRRWHDPLALIDATAPSRPARSVLWTVSALVLVMLVWANFGQLDIIASAEGKLVPQTLLKVVQPAEPGIVEALLVNEGERVKAGQVLVRLNPTIANATRSGIAADLASEHMQERRIVAELNDRPMPMQAGDDPGLYTQVASQFRAHRHALLEGLEQEQALLHKAEHERKSAAELLAKLDETVPTYRKAADAFAKLEKEGFLGGLAAADKQREAIEKAKDLAAQRATVDAMDATIAAQQKRVSQMLSNNRAELERELAARRARIAQLEPTLRSSAYREGLMELRAPQDGVIKDLATTTIGAVVQPGSVVLTLIPKDELLYADVAIKNEDIGFVRVGQSAQIKLATYPFQRYGMLHGKVIQISADTTEARAIGVAANSRVLADDPREAPPGAVYKARVQLDGQVLRDPQGNRLGLTAGLQAVAEINQGKRTVMEYLLSPVQKTISEAARER